MNESENSRSFGYGKETEEGARSDSASADNTSNMQSTPSALFIDERLRLEQKIEKLREEITRNSITREGDIEEYLKITAAMKNRPENPQMTRIRQHFEKKNRKYTHETESLQKKLEILEQRLQNLENGIESSLNKNGTHRVLQNVGSEIRRNLKEMTGNVISAPFDIAQKVKKNVFGSADNLPSAQKGSNIGLSTFYDESTQSEQHFTGSLSDRGAKCPSESSELIGDEDQKDSNLAPRIHLSSSGSQHDLNRISGIEESSTNLLPSRRALAEQLRELKQQNLTIMKSFEIFKKETETELRNQQTELINSRFKAQNLEQTLNETMELHQNEVKQLKSDLSLIGARMDYQYNDRFKKIEESVEAAQNRMIRMEASWLENSERLLGAGQNMWNALMLSGANIVVELLKITLYIISVLLDSVKPLTGTRKRAGIALSIAIGLFFSWNIFSSFFGNSYTNPSYSNVPIVSTNFDTSTPTPTLETLGSNTVK